MVTPLASCCCACALIVRRRYHLPSGLPTTLSMRSPAAPALVGLPEPHRCTCRFTRPGAEIRSGKVDLASAERPHGGGRRAHLLDDALVHHDGHVGLRLHALGAVEHGCMGEHVGGHGDPFGWAKAPPRSPKRRVAHLSVYAVANRARNGINDMRHVHVTIALHKRALRLHAVAERHLLRGMFVSRIMEYTVSTPTWSNA